MKYFFNAMLQCARLLVLMSIMFMHALHAGAVGGGPVAPIGGGPIGGPAAGMPKLSEEDMRVLQDVEQEINKFVTSLPAEEQKKFWQEVDELTNVMNTMSEDELVKFMENVLQEQEQPKPSMPPMPMPTPAPLPIAGPPLEKPAPVEVVPAVVITETHTQALKLIEALTLMLNNFLTKTQAILELRAKWKPGLRKAN